MFPLWTSVTCLRLCLIAYWMAERIRAEVLEELDALRHEVAELAERVDFAERLLAKPKEDSRQS